MITRNSTPAEVAAHHRKNIADKEAALATTTDPGKRAYIEEWIAGHRERLAKAEAAKPWTPADLPPAEWIAPTGARTWTGLEGVMSPIELDPGPMSEKDAESLGERLGQRAAEGTYE